MRRLAADAAGEDKENASHLSANAHSRKIVRIACVESDEVAYWRTEQSLRAFLPAQSVERYDSGLGAVSGVPSNKPDMVLINSELSDISGLECTKRLNRLVPTLHIIVCSSRDNFHEVFLALAAGASGYMVTPARSADLVNAVRDAEDGLPFLCGRSLASIINGLRNCGKSLYGELSRREHEVMASLMEDCSNKGVADALHISANTARVHITHLLKKLHVTDRKKAIRRFLGVE